MYLLLTTYYYVQTNIIIIKVGPKETMTTKSEGLYILQVCTQTMVTWFADTQNFHFMSLNMVCSVKNIHSVTSVTS